LLIFILNFRALKAGIKKPLLSLLPVSSKNPAYKHGNLVSILGALHALYVPLEVRESNAEKAHKAELMGLECPGDSERLRKLALALESGRYIIRMYISSFSSSRI